MKLLSLEPDGDDTSVTSNLPTRIFMYGIKAIAKILNAEGIKSQGFYQQKLLGKKLGDNKPEIARRFLWENTGVKRLLQNEFYCGTLVCHRSYTSKINHIRKNLPKEEQYRHEDAVPAIISREKWEQAQFLLRDNVERNVRAGQNSPHHRYTGLIKCGDCGSSFVCRKRVWKDSVRYEYTCNGYHRYGKENCSSHRVDEAQLDKLIYDELLEMKEGAEANYKSIEHDVKKWLSQKNTSEKKVKALSDKLKQRKSDQEQILLERIRDREHADIYTGMLTKCEKDIANITAELAAIQDYDATIRKRKAEMKSSIDILGEIVKEGAISDSNLRLLIDDIVISECGGKLSINIHLKAAFRSHLDIYDENGQLTDQAFAVS